MKFIHFEIPKDNNNVPTIPVKEVGNLMSIASNILEPEVKVVASPFKITWNNEIAEIDNINELNISDEAKVKFLEFVTNKLKENNITYTILETL